MLNSHCIGAWSAACITPGGEELRYLKFWLRAELQGQPYAYDKDECVILLKPTP